MSVKRNKVSGLLAFFISIYYFDKLFLSSLVFFQKIIPVFIFRIPSSLYFSGTDVKIISVNTFGCHAATQKGFYLCQIIIFLKSILPTKEPMTK